MKKYNYITFQLAIIVVCIFSCTNNVDPDTQHIEPANINGLWAGQILTTISILDSTVDFNLYQNASSFEGKISIPLHNLYDISIVGSVSGKDILFHSEDDIIHFSGNVDSLQIIRGDINIFSNNVTSKYNIEAKPYIQDPFSLPTEHKFEIGTALVFKTYFIKKGTIRYDTLYTLDIYNNEFFKTWWNYCDYYSLEKFENKRLVNYGIVLLNDQSNVIIFEKPIIYAIYEGLGKIDYTLYPDYNFKFYDSSFVNIHNGRIFQHRKFDMYELVHYVNYDGEKFIYHQFSSLYGEVEFLYCNYYNDIPYERSIFIKKINKYPSLPSKTINLDKEFNIPKFIKLNHLFNKRE